MMDAFLTFKRVAQHFVNEVIVQESSCVSPIEDIGSGQINFLLVKSKQVKCCLDDSWELDQSVLGQAQEWRSEIAVRQLFFDPIIPQTVEFILVFLSLFVINDNNTS
jgi:hypothetical protein